MRATLSVTTGPDRGKSFDLTEPMTHIGSGPENQVVLSDQSVAEHQASIASRDGRYFIYAPATSEIEVDGNRIPPEQRVWLPEEATIQLSRRTALQFVCTDGGGNGASEMTQPDATSQAAAIGADAPAPNPGRATVRTKRVLGEENDSIADLPKVKQATGEKTDKKPEKRKPKVAKFITDGPGNLLVKLGEDGHLPELTLEEGVARSANEPQQKQSNPLLLIAAICFSFGMTALLLFMEPDVSGGGGAEWATAVQEIGEYYGGEGDDLKPYQTHLRLARQAHSRHDYQGERDAYHKVLDLLHAEGKSKFTGLTGTPERDEKLEHLIAVLLGR